MGPATAGAENCTPAVAVIKAAAVNRTPKRPMRTRTYIGMPLARPRPTVRLACRQYRKPVTLLRIMHPKHQYIQYQNRTKFRFVAIDRCIQREPGFGVRADDYLLTR